MYILNVEVLDSRLTKLEICAVANNATLSFNVKGVFSVAQIRQLFRMATSIADESVYKVAMLIIVFRF